MIISVGAEHSSMRAAIQLLCHESGDPDIMANRHSYLHRKHSKHQLTGALEYILVNGTSSLWHISP
ncbi:hypothetical protein SERLA73DRAFT_189368 [Serpula lacrymans var. lacrymans S7.3]|uniref:Uncharacterized protein n=2 Tax=Serpula lacrymans var. lacrymans TaxID=341189 RepID=F8QDG8_SERL3|nr:uncharacterized protein SERLADRAFT_480151 [Serpula lacrymans var. lacrymans S7.9]EGN93639.1 hypothetical protein SERLA73DRAFT_189368 [Serpula lacrymans var. lacrymans S7.3]EGO19016.1 hypothetical protein SERLADRAFT_480151 [Serpula lacrymans var. lacrymans S7.9]